MTFQKQTDLSDFFLAGISYRKSDANVRGIYAVTNEHYADLFPVAAQKGIKSFFILSTCNRTEIYGFADDAADLCSLLCSGSRGRLGDFMEIAYIKRGKDAVSHLFEVAAGLDSQILGDYEIVGQIKQAAKISKQHGFVDAYLERMLNAVLQTSKEIKSSTSLSGGTVSVSFAAIQCIRSLESSIADKKILLVGIGKIGRSTCRNLVDYLGTNNITIINRTEEKAKTLAKELNIRYAPLEEIGQQVREADIILTATNSAVPVILHSYFQDNDKKLIIDLSIPYNVEEQVKELEGITLINVDDLSKLKDETLQKRQEEIPAALAIIEKHVGELFEWQQMRRHVPLLKAVKSKLEELNTSSLYISYSSSSFPATKTKEKIQHVINGMAVKMRDREMQGCYYIEAMHEFIAAGG